MAFSIDAFKASIEKQGGLARLNVFEVRFSKPLVNGVDTSASWVDANFTNNDLRFFCQTVILPGIGVDAFSHRPNNIDIVQSIPFAITRQDLECVFMVDDRHSVLKYFHSWMNEITNYSPVVGQGPSQSTPRLIYELGYKKEYSQTMDIVVYSRSPSTSSSNANGYICRLRGVFPVQVGHLNLSWNANDEYGTLPVSFSFESFDMIPVVDGIEQTKQLPEGKSEFNKGKG